MEEQRYQHRNKDPNGQRHRFPDRHVHMRKLDTQEDGEKEIDAFELWCWRRILRTSWTSMATNKTILEQVKPKTTLEGKITKQRLSYFGYIMRANFLETTLFLSMVSGRRRRRGHQRTRWMDTIKNLPMKEWKEVKDRKTWRMIIHKVTESRLRLNG